MRRSMWVMAAVAFLVAAGASALVVVVGWGSSLDPSPHAMFLGGALVGGLTMRRLAGRRAIPLAATATFVWIGVHLIVASSASWAQLARRENYAYLLAAAPLAAALAAAIPLPFDRETRWRLLWLSALLTFGCFAVPATFAPLSRIGAPVGLCGPLLAGGLTQYLATHRRVWTCGGGGALIYALALLERADNPMYLVALISTGFGALLGAGGAAIAWNVFRHSDPREPTLPSATTVT